MDARPAEGTAPYAEDSDMRNRAAAKWFGGIAATLMVTMVTTVAPASAAKNDDTKSGKVGKGGGGNVTIQRFDTGWG